MRVFRVETEDGYGAYRDHVTPFDDMDVDYFRQPAPEKDGLSRPDEPVKFGFETKMLIRLTHAPTSAI
jgi:hypothetical protein